VHRFGYQEGVVPLGDRVLRVRKPRLRTKASPDTPSREAAVPAYETLRDDPRAGARVMALLARGVSTRDYAKAIPEMAGTLGVSKSAVSREFIERTETAHDELMARRLDGLVFPVILLDGKLFGEHHVITALGIDDAGAKHILGIAHGASENAEVVKELLRSLVERGVKPGPPGSIRLFIVDGSKAIRAAISEVFGSENPVQRCVAHKARNVQDQLPIEQRKYAKMVITAAVRMEPAKGIERLRAYAKELGERWPGAAASLREGMEDLFTVSRLGLPELLAASLRTTNIIESGQSLIGKFTGRVKNWKTPGMALRWHAAACLDAEKRMKRTRGYKHLPLLGAALGTTLEKIRKVA
jgi:transposase-like protein